MKTQYIVSIVPDTNSGNPRDSFDHFSTLYTWHPRYRIGGMYDITNGDPNEFMEYLAFDILHMKENANNVEIVNAIKENICMVPIYIYDHSGITIQTTPFSCPWDSGQVGWIFITKETCKEVDIKFEGVRKILESQIEELNQYLTGDVWGYTIYSREVEDNAEELLITEDISEDLIHLDSCWGYYGYDYCKQEALDTVRHYIKQNQEIASEAA